MSAHSQQAAADVVLETRGLRVAYGPITVVSDVHLVVPSGSVVALIGPNGAGKTSTLRAIGGQKRSRGTIVFDGHDMSNPRPHKMATAGFAQVPQGRRLFSELSVQENLLLGAWGQSRAERRQQLAVAYEMFPRLKERRAQLAGSLSGGEQQMVAIARAFIRQPRLIAMDEPSLGLAPIIVKEVFTTISKIRDAGVAVLLVEQNATQALAVSDYVYVLKSGRVAYEGDSRVAARELDTVRAYLHGG